MLKCLLVSKNIQSFILLKKLLNESNYTFASIETCEDSEVAKQKLQEEGYDIVVINTPLKQDFGHNLSLYAARSLKCSVLMLVKKELYYEVSEEMNRHGVLCVEKPIHKGMFLQAISLALSMRTKLQEMEAEKHYLEQELEVFKVINEAKYILMEQLLMSESDAHHYLEKEAMHKQKTKLEIANEIIKTYT